jgi:hypothetical protein
VSEKPGVVLADAGYWKNDAIEAIVNQGIQTLVAPTQTTEKNRVPLRRPLRLHPMVLAADWGN